MNKDQLLYLYFSNSLTPSQEELFNELLENDAEFKAQFEFESNLKQVIRAEKSDDLKTKLKSFETTISSKNKASKPWFNWRMAASIVLFLGAGWFGYESLFGLNYDNLYDSNYKNYPNTVYTITRSDDANTLERQAFVAYETQDYKLAIDKFNVAKQQPYFNFYKAQSYLGLDDLDEAKALFNTEVLNESQFKAEAYWYLALINLKQENKAEAIKHLKTLTSKFNYKKDDANTLLNSLN
ncbi:tetratricopeptide repeat protein [Olleya sp. R77988]|uniref:tetratricopeptide repeat protein n=1 Tax=Olleya sp. R77988 TaxID=3093875 RepID=UPI0037C53711